MHQESVREKIESALDTMRPYLDADGGNVEVIGISEEGDVFVRLLGTCRTCPQSFMTMKAGIEDAVKRAVPSIRSVQAVMQTDEY